MKKLKRVLVSVPTGGGSPRDGMTGMACAVKAGEASAMQIPLGQLAEISLVSGPAMIRDESGCLSDYVFYRF